MVRKKAPAQLDPEVAKSVEEFVSIVGTDARFAQGLTTVCPDGPDIRQLGAFLQWVAADVRKECQAELDAAGLSWKQVGKPLSARAKAFFLAKRDA